MINSPGSPPLELESDERSRTINNLRFSWNRARARNVSLRSFRPSETLKINPRARSWTVCHRRRKERTDERTDERTAGRKIDTRTLSSASPSIFQRFRLGNSSKLRALGRLSSILGHRKSCNEKMPPFSCPLLLAASPSSLGANKKEREGKENGKRKEK